MRPLLNALVLKYSDNTIATTSDPEEATPTISAESTVGDSDTAILSMWPFAQSMFFGKEDGLYYLYSDGDVYQGPMFRQSRSTYNFLNMRDWNSGGYSLLMCPMGVDALTYYQWGGTMDEVGPSVYAPRMSDFHGRVTTVTPDFFECYITTNPTGSNTKSKLLTIFLDDAGWHEHPLNEIDLNPISCGYISGLQATNRRLWYAGEKSGVVGIYYLILSNTADPTDDSNYKFTTDTAYLETSWVDAGQRGEEKVFFFDDMETEGASKDQYVTNSYTIDDGYETTLATEITDGVHRNYFPVDKVGNNIKQKFTLVTTADTASPELLSWMLGCRSAAAPYRQYRLRIVGSKGTVTNGGKLSTINSASDMIAELAAMREQHYVKMTHYLDSNKGTVVYLTMIPPSPRRMLVDKYESVFELMGLEAPTE